MAVKPTKIKPTLIQKLDWDRVTYNRYCCSNVKSMVSRWSQHFEKEYTQYVII